MWDLLGFKKNILFNNPIPIEESALNLLSGRNRELVEVIHEILADDKIVKVITGKVGIGKTSFLNVLQYLFYVKSDFFKEVNIYKRLLPCFYRVELSYTDNLETILIKILKVISRNLKEHYSNSVEKTPYEIKEIIDYWLGLKTEEIVEEKGTEFDLKLVKFSTTKTLSDIYINKTDPSFSLNALIDLLKENSKFDGVFVVFDNLELIEFNTLKNILNEIRDELFIKESIYYLLITADRQFHSKLFTEARRVSGMINSLELELKPLTPNQVINAIEERIDVFTKDEIKFPKNEKNVIKRINPFEQELVYKIYSFTNQELRETFKILHFIALKEFSDYRIIEAYNKGLHTVSSISAIDYLIEYAEKVCSSMNFESSIKDKLSIIYKLGKFGLKDIKKVGFKNKDEMKLFIEKLLKEGYTHEDKENSVYEITMRLELLAMANKLNKDCNEISLNSITIYN